MANYNFDNLRQREESSKEESNRNNAWKISFFGLKDDGDTAIVRFPYESSKDFEFATVHSVKIGKCYRNINCLTDSSNPNIKCPLCEKGDDKVKQSRLRFFIKLISYVKDEKGNIIPEAKTWDRPASFANELNTYYENYGNLSDIVFMLKRHGERGSMKTTYSLLPLKAEMYPENVYKKDFSAFNDFKFSNWIIMNKTAEEMDAFLSTGEFPKSENYTSKVETPITKNIPSWSHSSTTVQPTPTINNPVHTQENKPQVQTVPQTTPTYNTPNNDPTISRPRRYTNLN